MLNNDVFDTSITHKEMGKVNKAKWRQINAIGCFLGEECFDWLMGDEASYFLFFFKKWARF